MWCLAHRLELAIKDALKGTVFDHIDEMLLRLYSIYERSPKKCRELKEIVTHLKEYLSTGEGGIKPVRASGSRWIAHKWGAMKCILSKYGAYTNHLTTLSEDVAVRSADTGVEASSKVTTTNGSMLSIWWDVPFSATSLLLVSFFQRSCNTMILTYFRHSPLCYGL